MLIVGDALLEEAEELNEVKDKKGKGSGTKDACYYKVKSRYSVWPSAYASGALVKCRKVGAANWGNSKKEEVEVSGDNLIERGMGLSSQQNTSYNVKPNPNQSSRNITRGGMRGTPPKPLKGEKKPYNTSPQGSPKTITVDHYDWRQELEEKCWPGYEKKGMKTMFGKRYPNCVKKSKKKK